MAGTELEVDILGTRRPLRVMDGPAAETEPVMQPPCHSLVQANSPAICMCVCLCLKDADTQGSSGLKHGSHAVGEASRIGVGIYSTNVVAKADGLVAMLQLLLQIVGLQNVNQPNLLRWGTPTMLKLCPMVVVLYDAPSTIPE